MQLLQDNYPAFVDIDATNNDIITFLLLSVFFGETKQYQPILYL